MVHFHCAPYALLSFLLEGDAQLDDGWFQHADAVLDGARDSFRHAVVQLHDCFLYEVDDHVPKCDALLFFVEQVVPDAHVALLPCEDVQV